MLNAWVDYIAPQLYWQIDPPEQSYSALYHWWREQNKKVPVWPGGAVARVMGKWPANEIVRQIEISRQAPVPGYIHWNMSALAANPDKLQDKLLEKVYNEPALPPSNRSSTFAPLSKPVAVINREDDVNSTVRWSVLPADKSVPLVEFWVLQMRIAGKWQTEILPRESES